MLNSLLPQVNIGSHSYIIPALNTALSDDLHVTKDFANQLRNYALAIVNHFEAIVQTLRQDPKVSEFKKYPHTKQPNNNVIDLVTTKDDQGREAKLTICLDPEHQNGYISLSEFGGSFPAFVRLTIKPQPHQEIKRTCQISKAKLENPFTHYKKLEAYLNERNSNLTYLNLLNAATSFLGFCQRPSLEWSTIEDDGQGNTLKEINTYKPNVNIYWIRNEQTKLEKYIYQERGKKDAQDHLIQSLEVTCQDSQEGAQILSITRNSEFNPKKSMTVTNSDRSPLKPEASDQTIIRTTKDNGQTTTTYQISQPKPQLPADAKNNAAGYETQN